MKHLLNYSDGSLVSFHVQSYEKPASFKGHAKRVLKIAQTYSIDDVKENVSIALRCNALCCVVLYCIVLYLLYCIILYCIVL